MKLKKIAILLFFTTLSFIMIIISPVFASRVEFDTLGKCNVSGMIKAVNFEEAYEDPCVKDNDCPVGAFTPKRSARYIFSIYTDTIKCTPGEVDNPSTYESQFKLNDENSIILNLIDVKEGDQFQPGDKIRGTVEFKSLSNTFTSYELERSDAKMINIDIDNQKNIFENQQNNKDYIYLIAIAVITIITIILVWFFLIKRR